MKQSYIGHISTIETRNDSFGFPIKSCCSLILRDNEHIYQVSNMPIPKDLSIENLNKPVKITVEIEIDEPELKNKYFKCEFSYHDGYSHRTASVIVNASSDEDAVRALKAKYKHIWHLEKVDETDKSDYDHQERRLAKYQRLNKILKEK